MKLKIKLTNGLMKLKNLLEINIIIMYMSINYTPNNTFIFTFVRMNPPTPGHLLLIKNLIDKALEVGSEKAYIITSSSMDGKNPIPCNRETLPNPKKITKADKDVLDRMTQTNFVFKSSILQDMITAYKRQLIDCDHVEGDTEPSKSTTTGSATDGSATPGSGLEEKAKSACVGDNCAMVGGNRKSQIENLHVIVLCSTGNPFGFIYNIIKRDFIDKGVPKINMFFVVGRDRAPFLDTVIDTFKTKDFISSIGGDILSREGMNELKLSGPGECSIEDIDPSAYSASFVRGLVKNGEREKFNQVYDKFLSAEDIQKMFETIQLGSQMKIPASKDEDENPQSRYYDIEKSLPLIIELGGKRPRKTSKVGRKARRTLGPYGKNKRKTRKAGRTLGPYGKNKGKTRKNNRRN